MTDTSKFKIRIGMKAKRVICFIFISSFCICSSRVTADTVYLKSGKRTEGNILARSERSVMIQTENGEYKTYTLDKVEKIEKGPRINIESNRSGPRAGNKSSVKTQGEAKTIDRSKYILYLPGGLRYHQKHTLVIALSPSANAKSMIRTWKPVADKNKWIIFASKKFKNHVAMNKVIPGIASIITKDILPNYPVDRSRIVATGFSGGAMGSHAFSFLHPRLISAVVVNTGMINEFYIKKKKNEYPGGKYAVFLTSPGDFRYDEMKRDRVFLESLGWKTEWIEFQGGHTIAPVNIYQEAAQWLTDHLR